VNIHHLELFYHVVKNGGITAASRNMPYGIQQAAISGQVAQLEEDLGVVLFQRRPFALTAPGKKLYNFVKPFFDNVEPMAQEVRGGVVQHLRIAASEIVLQDYLPDMIQQTRQQFPKLKVTLREGYHPEVVKWLEQREVDLALGLLGGQPPHGIHSLAMFKLPLVLLVPQQSKIQSAEDLWRQDHLEEKLITTPANQVICRAFEEGLAQRKVDWFSSIEVSTIALVETYVVNGYGIGVTVGIPTRKYNPQIRLLPLAGFPTTTFGVLWQGFRTPVLDHFLKVVQQAAQQVSAGLDPSVNSASKKAVALPARKTHTRPLRCASSAAESRSANS
jgi:DNA-binding transcriptional LysR family regulator